VNKNLECVAFWLGKGFHAIMMNPKTETQLEIYRKFVSTLRSSRGSEVKLDDLNELYGEGWRSDTERIVSIDEKIKEAGEIQSYLSPGLFALDFEKEERKNRVKERLSDTPLLRKAQRTFVIQFVATILVAIVTIWIASMFVSMESKFSETIAAAVFIGAIGAVVGSYREYRKTLSD